VGEERREEGRRCDGYVVEMMMLIVARVCEYMNTWALPSKTNSARRDVTQVRSIAGRG
jgi:hypothetical protein